MLSNQFQFYPGRTAPVSHSLLHATGGATQTGSTTDQNTKLNALPGATGDTAGGQTATTTDATKPQSSNPLTGSANGGTTATGATGTGSGTLAAQPAGTSKGQSSQAGGSGPAVAPGGGGSTESVGATTGAQTGEARIYWTF